MVDLPGLAPALLCCVDPPHYSLFFQTQTSAFPHDCSQDSLGLWEPWDQREIDGPRGGHIGLHSFVEGWD